MKAKLVTVLLLLLSVYPAVATEPAKNVVLCVGDGMGPEHIKAGRYFAGEPLSFESFPNTATVSTYSLPSNVTDSAAAATAMATGHKVFDGVLSMAIPGDSRRLRTVLESFKMAGKACGLVTTSYLTDATPAAFGAHAERRSQAASIAQQYFNTSKPDVLLGGGGAGMTVEAASAAGYSVVTNVQGLQKLTPDVGRIYCGIFGTKPMPYETDGLGELPHLSRMTEKALELLQANTNGFFLMVEGGLIDKAAHKNDIGPMVREIVEFSKAVRTVVNWSSNRTDTLVIVVGDHETGGLKVEADNGRGVEPKVSWESFDHTGADIIAFARGPGAEKVAGSLSNTNLFYIMMDSLRQAR